MSALKATQHEVEKSIDQAEFVENPAKAFRLASDGARVAIVSLDGKRRAILSVPQAALTFDSE